MRRGEVKEAHLLDPPVHLRLTEVAVVDVSWATGAEARVLPAPRRAVMLLSWLSPLARPLSLPPILEDLVFVRLASAGSLYTIS
jgi:hypothetical protein